MAKNNPLAGKQVDLFSTKEYIVKKSNPRILPLDIIYTLDDITHVTALIAFSSGWKVGIRSQVSGTKVPKMPGQVEYVERWQWRFNITFIDNAYTDYSHALHLSVVKRFTPKYCTVMDIMTEEQCKKDNITCHPLEQVLDWAEELSQYAENVIVIPKYDCLDKIPEKFMLGYSIPTSHGGTPLPLEMFRGRRIHLLGGSWKNQLKAIELLGDSVVSIDNNYINKMAQYSQYVTPDGESFTLSENAHLAQAVNPMSIAFAISAGNIAFKINQLYKEPDHV